MSDGADGPSGRENQANWAVLVSSNSFFWSRIVLANVILLAVDWVNSWAPAPGPEESIEICQTPSNPLLKKIIFSQFTVEQSGQENCGCWLRQQIVKFKGKHHSHPQLPPALNWWMRDLQIQKLVVMAELKGRSMGFLELPWKTNLRQEGLF